MTRKRHAAEIEAKEKQFRSKWKERMNRNASCKRFSDPWELDELLDLYWSIVGFYLEYFAKYAARTCEKRGYPVDYEKADDLAMKAVLKGYTLLKDQYSGMPVNFVFDADNKGDLRGWVLLLLGTGAGFVGCPGIIGEHIVDVRRNREDVLLSKNEDGEDSEVVLPDTQDDRLSLYELLNEELADRFIPLYDKISAQEPNERLAMTALLVARVAENTHETVADVIGFLVKEIYLERERSTAVRSLSAILENARTQPIYNAIAAVVQRSHTTIRRWEKAILKVDDSDSDNDSDFDRAA